MEKEKMQRAANVPAKDKKDKKFAEVNNGVFVYTTALTVGDLAKKLNVQASDIIKKLFLQKKIVTINQFLDDDTIGELCLEYGFDFKKEEIVNEEDFEKANMEDDPKDLQPRSPVVTVMGHVDHGKTTLIDAIRNSNLTEKEVGGISQEIGAYVKTFKNNKITFIDTPGHEAFSAMRARGASVTDIVILVVAADDGVMPQTIEAIDHAKAAKVPIIVAVNKMDAPGANPKRVVEQLMAHDVISEEFGGDVMFCQISAKKKEGIDGLLECVVAQSEMLELKANPKRYAFGTVLEAELDKGEGPRATLLVQNGSLTNSDYVVVGTAYGKVRRMTNEFKQIVKVAGPATPVSVIGLSEVPNAGDRFMAFPTEKQAKDIAEKRKLKKVDDERKAVSSISSLDDVFDKMNKDEMTTINIVLKTDSTGSAEAVKASLEKLNNDKVRINVVRASAGAITESDLLLASASNSIVYGFNIRPTAQIVAKAKEQKIEIRLHRIIYQIIEELEAAMKGMLKKEKVEEVTGQAEVRSVFKVSKVGEIAGSYVTSGFIKHNSLCRILRDGLIIFEGKIDSLKRFKDDAKEVKEGFECGIKVESFNDIKEGDIIEGYQMVEEKDGK